MTIPYLLNELQKVDAGRDKVDLSIACLCLRARMGDQSLVEEEKKLLKVVLNNGNLPSWEKTPLLFNELLTIEDYSSLLRTLFNEMSS